MASREPSSSLWAAVLLLLGVCAPLMLVAQGPKDDGAGPVSASIDGAVKSVVNAVDRVSRAGRPTAVKGSDPVAAVLDGMTKQGEGAPDPLALIPVESTRKSADEALARDPA